MSADGNQEVRGIANPSQHQIVYFFNVGSGGVTDDIKFKNNNTNADPENRILSDGDLTVKLNDSAVLYYDAISLRWRVLSSTV
jgi:hypothetical protein